jgi:hypothetical protein
VAFFRAAWPVFGGLRPYQGQTRIARAVPTRADVEAIVAQYQRPRHVSARFRSFIESLTEAERQEFEAAVLAAARQRDMQGGYHQEHAGPDISPRFLGGLSGSVLDKLNLAPPLLGAGDQQPAPQRRSP